MNSLKKLEHESIKHACGTWNIERWRTLWLSVQLTLEAQHHRLKVTQYEGLDFLLARPWFKRVWVLQEVAHAKRAVIYSGTNYVFTHIFALALQLLDMNPEPNCQAVLDIMPGHLRKGSWWNRDRDLCTLLKKFHGSQASDPRDMIYALLEISSDAQNTNSLRADYTKDCKQVALDIASFLFSLSAGEYQRGLYAHDSQSSSQYDSDNMHIIPVFRHSLAILNMESLCKLARSCGAASGAEFIKRRGHDTRVMEVVVEASFKSTKGGIEGLEPTTGKREFEIEISEKIAEAAAGTTEHGTEVMNFLLRYRGAKINIARGCSNHSKESNKREGDNGPSL